MQLQEILWCKRTANIHAVITYFGSFLPLLTKIKNFSKWYMPLNMLIDSRILISVLVKWGQLFFIYSELFYMSTSEQEPFTCIVKNSGTSKVIYNLFSRVSFPFFLYISAPFLFSPQPRPTPPRYSQIFPWRWTAQIVTATGQWKISVVWNHLERIEIILWAEIILLIKDTSYLKAYSLSTPIWQSHCK